MSTVKLRGTKKVDEVVPDSYQPGLKDMKLLQKTTKAGAVRIPQWKDYFIAPFPEWWNEHDNGILSLLALIFMLFFVCLITGIIFFLTSDKVAADINAGTLNPATGSIIIAFVQLGLIYCFGIFTRDTQLPVYVLLEKYFSVIVTGKFGLLTACAAIFIGGLGYMCAGFALISLNGGAISANSAAVQPIVNVATGSLSYLLFWLMGSVINLGWLWVTQFKTHDDDTEEIRYSHGVAVVAILTFVGVLAFYGATAPGHGLVVFSPGLYFAGMIYQHSGRSYPGDPSPPEVTFMLVGLFAIPVTAMVMHFVWNFLISYVTIPPGRGRNGQQQQQPNLSEVREPLLDKNENKSTTPVGNRFTKINY